MGIPGLVASTEKGAGEKNEAPALFVTAESLPAMTEKWLKQIEPYNQHRNVPVRKDKVALLVIDMQNLFFDPKSPQFTPGGPAILPNVKRLISAFREAGRPVIYTAQVQSPNKDDWGILYWWWGGVPIKGTYETAFIEEIQPAENEKVIYKHRYSAFYNTDLEIVLRNQDIEDVVICGVMTNLCCESTARDAFFRDYRVFFPVDGNGSINEEMHLGSLRTLSFAFAVANTVDDIIRQMKGEEISVK
ncbi:MAG: cysteine hydrolase [Candidatus Eremiobacteraeota bacterium]|nr:cysteine hydrolase [Candidatus Eremiobacteraeota bacterium]